MVLIFIIILALYIIAIISTYQNMFAFEKTTKILYLILGFIIVSIITVIISKIGLPNSADNKEILNVVKRTIQIIFIPLNALIILPFMANNISKYKVKAISEEKLKKRILIMSIVYIIFIIFEKNYIKDFHIGVLANMK